MRLAAMKHRPALGLGRKGASDRHRDIPCRRHRRQGREVSLRGLLARISSADVKVRRVAWAHVRACIALPEAALHRPAAVMPPKRAHRPADR